MGVRLLTLGQVEPARVPLYVNAANAVLVPSEREGFGLATLEALACDVPVLSTPVGIAPEALENVTGALCHEFDAQVWRAALAAAPDEPGSAHRRARPRRALLVRRDGRAGDRRLAPAARAALGPEPG